MKKIAAILFLGILLFNGFGYRWVASFFDQKAAENLVALIDQEQYNASELISIKTPIGLPYYVNSAKFERIDGEMVIDGVVYQYVERRVFNDSLEIKVLPNQDRLHIKNAREDFYKLAQDIQKNGTDKKSVPINKSVQKFVAFDYLNDVADYSLKLLVSLNSTIGSDYSDCLLSNCLPVQLPPPKFLA